MKWVILWLLLAVVAFAAIGSMDLPFFYRIRANGVRQQAIATKLTPEFHYTVYYRYQVDGANFEGRDHPWPPNPPLNEIKVGQSLVVYYDPQNPSRSVLGNPEPMLTNELAFVGVVALVFPTAIVFGLMHYLRKSALEAKREINPNGSG
jgi:hypothetical protein